MSSKLEFVDRSIQKKCRTCKGKDKKCKDCSGTGVYIETNYFIISELKNGQKIAFQSDFIGK